MKNYNEMANDVFRRRDEYKIIQKKRRKTAIGITSSVMCFCLIAVIGFYGVSGEKPNTKVPVETTNSNTIVINKIDDLSSNGRKMNFGLLKNDLIPMSKQDLIEYYKVDVFPTVPKDLKEDNSGDYYSIYKRNGGTGEVYWDQNVLNYFNSDFTRSINIELCKNKLPFSDYGSLDESDKKSIINKTPVTIGLIDESVYMAEFIYKNVGFRIVFEGLSKEEMISVLTSIIKI